MFPSIRRVIPGLLQLSPLKTIAVGSKYLPFGTLIVLESEETQAALHASIKAWVESVTPLGLAPKLRILRANVVLSALNDWRKIKRIMIGTTLALVKQLAASSIFFFLSFLREWERSREKLKKRLNENIRMSEGNGMLLNIFARR